MNQRTWSVVAALCLVCSPALAENWPQWRGARQDGVSLETGLPLTWSKTENVVWRTPLPGPAGSTPVIWDDHIFLTSANGEQLELLALDTSGALLWRKVMSDHNQKARGDEGNGASPSPCTDGKHVWALVGSGDLGCFTFDGREIWRFNLQDRYGKFVTLFGLTSTPALDGDRLYVQWIHTKGARVIALDNLTGKEIWNRDRPSDARAECLDSYASPIVYRDASRAFLLSHGADYIVAHNLKDGEEIWRCGGLNPKAGYNDTLRLVSTPLAVPGLIIVPSAKSGPLLALDPASKGDISDQEQGHFWVREHDTPDVPSPLVHDGLVYVCRENGVLSVIDAKSGEELYLKRPEPFRHRASPTYVDGKILLTARNGTISVIKPGREYELLAQNKMEEDMSSSPAIAGGRIYLRTFQALYAIEQK